MKKLIALVLAIITTMLLAACNDGDKLLGAWQCTNAAYQGQSLNCSGGWTFDKDGSYSGHLNITGAAKDATNISKFLASAGPYRWKLNTSTNPMQIDLWNASDASAVVHAIVELQTDTTMRIGMPLSDNTPPPADFASSLTINFKKS